MPKVGATESLCWAGDLGKKIDKKITPAPVGARAILNAYALSILPSNVA